MLRHAVVHCFGLFPTVESFSLQRLHVSGVWNLCMGARLCPFRETKCCQAAAPTLQRGSGRPWQCLGFGRGSQPVLQEEAWRRQGCRCCPAPTALTAETKPSKLLGCFCWGTVKFQAHSADPQFRPPCAPGCDMPAALCWCDWECVLGSQSRHWVCVLGLCCVSFLLCVLSSLESEGT